ncbi:hypothetical protein CR513_31211, partial [Mucuna pruriens]
MDCSMIDVASGGALMDKTPVAARPLVSNMASNTQQFGTRGTPNRHETESDNAEIVGAIGGNQYGQQSYQTRQFDGQQFGRPSSSQGKYVVTRFGSQLLSIVGIEISSANIPTTATINADTEQLSIHRGMDEFQQNMNAKMHDLKMQNDQLANSVSQIQSTEYGNLPSQIIPNPKGRNVSAVTLRSGKELQVVP